MKLYDYKFVLRGNSKLHLVGRESVPTMRAFHIDVEGCDIIIPFAWFIDGEVKELTPEIS